MQKEIFIITELFYPNKTSTAYIMTEIAKSMAAQNTCKVNVVCADIVYDNNYDPAASESDLIGLNIIRTRRLLRDKNTLSGKFRNAIQTCFAFGKILIRKVKATDTVFAVTNPFLLVILIAFIRLFKNFRYILLVHDVFPENMIPAGLTNRKSISFKLLKIIYDRAYSKADKLIVLGRDMADLISNKIATTNKINIIENWFDEDLLTKQEVNRNDYLNVDLAGKIVIGFAGNIGRVQNVKTFLELFKRVNNPRLFFLIVGDGAMKEEVETMIHKENIMNVLYLGAKPRSEQSFFLNCCDIGLITLSQGMYGLGVPSKTYNLLALGIPIFYIGDQNSEIDLLIKEYMIGWSFDWNQELEIIEFMNTLNSLDNRNSEKLKHLAVNNFTEDIILSKINKLIF